MKFIIHIKIINIDCVAWNNVDFLKTYLQHIFYFIVVDKNRQWQVWRSIWQTRTLSVRGFGGDQNAMWQTLTMIGMTIHPLAITLYELYEHFTENNICESWTVNFVYLSL